MAIFLAGIFYNPSDKKATLLPTTWYQKLKLTKGSVSLRKTRSDEITKQDTLSRFIHCDISRLGALSSAESTEYVH